MNISDVAEQTGLPAKTIRYYEEIGLVHPDRGANGYRVFADTHLHQLAFLGRARALGFSIEDCRTLLSLYQDKTRASGDVKEIAQEHLNEIDAKIAQLRQMRDTLNDLIRSCAGDTRPDCPILTGLAEGQANS
ncbi:MAG: Cu(I)-responsive transcriptional regulator [Rhodobacteraceae bacterium]|jgi:Cu(I)-responsive transcriptional regulator|nr:Cu(I)-responsive transcriptional regulator [Paracoccaceae bacterium]